MKNQDIMHINEKCVLKNKILVYQVSFVYLFTYFCPQVLLPEHIKQDLFPLVEQK